MPLEEAVRGRYRVKSGPEGTQLIPPAAIVPMPAIIIALDPAGLPKTADQSVVKSRYPRTSTLKAPKRYVDQVEQTRSALMPRPETTKVQPTKNSRVTTMSGVLLRTPNSRSSTVSTA